MGSLGELQQLVLLAIVRLGAEATSGAIREELETVAGRRVSVGSVHVTLTRLERQGLVASERAPRAEGELGRPRLRYSVTAQGRDRLSHSRDTFARMWAGVELR